MKAKKWKLKSKSWKVKVEKWKLKSESWKVKVEKPHEPHLAAFMEAYLGAAANNAEFHYQCCNRLLIILFSIKTFAIDTRPSGFTKYQLLHISEFILKTTEEIPIFAQYWLFRQRYWKIQPTLGLVSCLSERFCMLFRFRIFKKRF